MASQVRRSGRYAPIVKDVLNFPLGEIRSLIIKVQHHCTGDRKHRAARRRSDLELLGV